jgi:hypothetical protein
MPINPETLRFYESTFRLVAIERLSKVAYPNISPDVCMTEGGNLAAGSDGKHIFLDCDNLRLAPVFKEVVRRTMTIKSAKGWGFILLGPIPDDILTRIFNFKASAPLGDIENLEEAKKDREYWRSLGFKDDTCIHGWNFELKGVLNDQRLLEKTYQDYYLLPPSITCKYQGHRGRVRDHSSTFTYCNQSPDHRHHYYQRQWFNKTPELLTFSEFWDIVWNRRAS